MVSMCKEAIEWYVNKFTNKMLLELVQSDRNAVRQVLVGFAQNEKSMANPIVKKRLVSYLEKNTEAQMKLIPTSNEAQEMVSAMIKSVGDQWVHDNWRSLLEASYDPRMLIAVFNQYDSDSFIGRLGHRLLYCPSLWKPLPNTEATDVYEQVLKSFERNPVLNGCLTLFLFAANERPKALYQSTPQQQQPSQQENKAAKRLQDEQKAHRETKGKLNEALTRLERLQEKNEAAEKEIKRLTHDHQEELQRINAEHQRQTDEAVTQERLRLLGVDTDWLSESQQVKDDVEQAIFEARHILEVQRQSNELHGTRAALREKLSVLDKLYSELQNTVQEALVIHPDTEHALRQLEKVQAALQDQLLQGGMEHKVGQPFLYYHLMAKIKSFTLDERLPDSLQRLRECASNAQAIGMLTQQEHTDIISACTEQEHLWHNLRMEQFAMPKQQRTPGNIPEILELTDRPEMPQVTIFLDAYNVIRRSEYWNRLITERKGNNTEVRLAFNKKCIGMGNHFRKIKIVYDGNDPLRNTVERFPGVDIIFAKRSQEEHNADNYIIDYVLHHKRAGDLFWLVSDDHDLCVRARPALDAIVSTQAFNKFIGASTR